jgi:hypothetical protein
MGISRQILAELPMLRRFARASTGSQDLGDAYVEAALSNLLAMPEMAAGGADIKLVLYKLLVGAMRSLDPGVSPSDQATPTQTANPSMEPKAPRHRSP